MLIFSLSEKMGLCSSSHSDLEGASGAGGQECCTPLTVCTSAQGGEILTLQEVGCQEGGRGIRAGQTLLQEVPLKLQGKQVSRREFKTPQTSTPEAPEHAPRMSPSQESTAPQETAVTRDIRADGEQRQSDRRPFAGGSSVDRVTCSSPHTQEHSDAGLPDTPHL